MKNQSTVMDEVTKTTDFNQNKFNVSKNIFKSGILYKMSRRRNNTSDCIGIVSTTILSGLVLSLIIIDDSFFTNDLLYNALIVLLFAILSTPVCLSLIVLLFKIFSGDFNDHIEDIYLEGYVDGYNDTAKSDHDSLK